MKLHQSASVSFNQRADSSR